MDKELLPISGPRQADRQRATLNQWTKTSWWTKYRQQAILIPRYSKEKLTLTLKAFQWTDQLFGLAYVAH
jgi:hypothetical protein